MNEGIKVFQLNDSDWWAGRSLEEVKVVYMKETGLPEDEAFDNPLELSAETMSKLKFVREDNSKVTFQDQLDFLVANEFEFPCFFASTEW